MSTITIRTAGISDAALIADMSRETFYDTFAADNTPDNMAKFMNEQFSREKLMAEVGESSSVFLLAYDGIVPVGYARMREGERRPEFNGDSAIEIARIYATKKAIGKGIGKALMTQCIEIAKTRGRSIIWLGVWEKNIRAIDFYTRWGFEKFAEHEFVLGDDRQTDWLLKKAI